MENYLDGTGKKICLHCKKNRTKEGYDGCVGELKNVMNACCGHGEIKMAYVQFNHKNYNIDPNKIRLNGEKALNYINKNKMKNTSRLLRIELIQRLSKRRFLQVLLRTYMYKVRFNAL